MRRRKPSAASRLQRFWIAFVVVLLVIGGAAYELASWPGFDPKSVTVEGNHETSSATILARSAIDPNRNVWFADTRAIAERVETLPYVKTARIHRGIPNRVTIDVTEREPFALVRTPSGRALVDVDLRVLVDDPPVSNVPVLLVREPVDLTPGVFLTDTALVTLRDAAQRLPAAHVIAASLGQDKYDELVITLPSGVRVLMGDDTDFDRKLGLIAPILDQLGKNERAISDIDLRAVDTPVVVFKNVPSRR